MDFIMTKCCYFTIFWKLKTEVGERQWNFRLSTVPFKFGNASLYPILDLPLTLGCRCCLMLSLLQILGVVVRSRRLFAPLRHLRLRLQQIGAFRAQPPHLILQLPLHLLRAFLYFLLQIDSASLVTFWAAERTARTTGLTYQPWTHRNEHPALGAALGGRRIHGISVCALWVWGSRGIPEDIKTWTTKHMKERTGPAIFGRET